MKFLASLRTRSPGPARETKAWDISGWNLSNRMTLRGHRSNWTVERAVQEGYERVVWVFKAVDTIASQQAKLPFRFEQVHDDGTREPVLDDPLVRLLNRAKVNDLETGYQFRHRLSGQILLSPMGAFVEIERNNAGDPIELHLLPPGRTRPVAGYDPVTGKPKLLSHYETIDAAGARHAIDPENVRWFRKPHPADPYRAITPLEAAGLAVDLEFLALLYNATFLRNDGRPGGVIGIKGTEVAPGEMNRIRDNFAPGAHHAGKVSVLSGELSYIDLSAKPRDMAYAELSKITKDQILAAFGVPESVMGNASQRTYENAAQEDDTFWLITMDDHLRLVSSGWDEDADDDIEAGFDTSAVPALQRAEAAKRTEAREEFAAGLISIDEYRVRAGLEPFDTVHSRSIFVAQGKTPLPTSEEDAVALGIAPPEQGGDTGGESTVEVEQITDEEGALGEEQAALPPGESAPTGQAGVGEEAVGGAQDASVDADDGGEGVDLAQDDGAAEAMARLQELLDSDTSDDEEEEDEEEDEEEGREAKRLPYGADGPAVPATARVRDQLDDALRSGLGQLVERLAERTAARVLSPKHRKGTRHFVAEYEVDTRVGDAPLDVDKLIPDYTGEAEQVLQPLVADAAAQVAAHLGVKSGHVDTVSGAVDETTAWLVSQVEATATDVRTMVAELDARGETAEEIAASVRGTVKGWSWWLPGGAARAATALVSGAGQAAAGSLAGGEAMVLWRARHAEHKALDGQAQLGGEPWRVNGAVLRYPGDLAGSVWETTGCTCFMVHVLPESTTATP
ncbi:phage portal protein [Streptosporangium sp. NPDC000563]|uniref:phage portal protein n=1 Tax=Streptosporangium sp. NPDC000563 TaxID=3154366 RepID=UPI00332DFFBA